MVRNTVSAAQLHCEKSRYFDLYCIIIPVGEVCTAVIFFTQSNLICNLSAAVRMLMWKLSSNPSNTNGVNEARKVLAIALKEAKLVSDVYLSIINFELRHGNNTRTATITLCIINGWLSE